MQMHLRTSKSGVLFLSKNYIITLNYT